jgi:Tail fiber protein gp32
MQNIAGFGLQIQVIASKTYPIGFNITELADDSDPFDVPSIQISEGVMGVNGDLLTFSKATPILTTVAVFAGGVDDINLGILLEANRVGKGKTSAYDVITLVGLYPNGNYVQMINGIITNGAPGNSVSSAGRLKTKVYSFAFENKVSTS